MTDLQIKYFLTVAELMSYTEAAKELYVSQPSVSKQIRTLENELGFELFDRSVKNRLRLTPIGMLFKESFGQMNNLLETSKQKAAELFNSNTPSLRVGIGEDWDFSGLITLTEQYLSQSFPSFVVEFEAYPFRTLHSLLASNNLDVIICVETGVQSFSENIVLPIFETSATAYFLKDSQKRGFIPEKITDFQGEPLYVLPASEAPLSKEINKGHLLSLGMSPEIIEKPNRNSMLLALSCGEGFAIFDQFARCKTNTKIGSIDLGISIPLCAIWKKSNPNRLIAPFIETAKAFFQTL